MHLQIYILYTLSCYRNCYSNLYAKLNGLEESFCWSATILSNHSARACLLNKQVKKLENHCTDCLVFSDICCAKAIVDHRYFAMILLKKKNKTVNIYVFTHLKQANKKIQNYSKKTVCWDIFVGFRPKKFQSILYWLKMFVSLLFICRPCGCTERNVFCKF